MRRGPQLGHLCSDDDDMNDDDNDDYVDDDDNDYDDDDNDDYNDDDDDDDVYVCMRRRGLSSATCAPTAAEENTPQFPTKCRQLGSRLLPSVSYVWLFVLHNINGIGPSRRAKRQTIC